MTSITVPKFSGKSALFYKAKKSRMQFNQKMYICMDRSKAEGSNRVYRGGSWNNNADNCRVANRNNAEPDNRNNNLGFRAAFVPQSGLAGGHSFGEGERAGGGSR